MRTLHRRFLLATPLLAWSIGLAGCASSTGPSSPPVTAATAQVWAIDIANALSAAGQVYLGQPGVRDRATVTALIADLQGAAAALVKPADLSSTKSAALSLIGYAQQLDPLVSPFLGGAGPAVALGLALLQAFVQGLPAPVGAPDKPPSSLHLMAVRYHPREAIN